jgi:hypothetical protein
MLIGVNEHLPVTILEGNHRLTAALLASEEIALSRFRIACGLSPRMTENCWYDTNLPNLWRYAKNRFRNIVDKEADVNRLLAAAAGDGGSAAAAVLQRAMAQSVRHSAALTQTTAASESK